MKQKILSLFLMTAILSLALVSAANFSVTSSTPVDLTKQVTNTSFLVTPNLQTNQSVNMVITLPQQIGDGNGNNLTINPPYSTTLNIFNGQTQGPFVVVYTAGTIPTNFNIGRFSANAVITTTDTTNLTNTITQNIPIYFLNDFCNSGEAGNNLSLSRVDINNNDGDDTDWKPLDSINVKVEVSNDGSNNVKKVFVELGLIDSAGKNIINKMDNLANKKINIGTISDGKTVTKDFKFNVPFDFNEENYKLVVKAYSEDQSGQKALCVSHSSDLDSNYYNTISGTRETDENKQIIVTNTLLSPETAQCGDKVELSGEVANIGDTDYTDKIKVTLVNTELKINSVQEINTDLNQGDSSSFTFDFDIPTTVTEKTYTLNMKTYYDYDTSDGTYGLSSDKTYTVSLPIAGNCKTTPVTPTITEPTISAELSSDTPEAIAGKEVAIQATIKNNANTEITYTISVSGNTDWSSLVSVEPRTVTIPAGSSKEVIATLNIDSTTVGDKEFTVKATYGDNQVKSYIGSVTVTKPSNPLGSIGTHFQENWYIYLIVLVNLVLIIAIIIVIRKMMKPRKA